MTTDQWDIWTKRLRDIVLLILGVTVVLFELISDNAVRWELLTVAVTMLGLPVMFNLQDRINGGKGDK